MSWNVPRSLAAVTLVAAAWSTAAVADAAPAAAPHASIRPFVLDWSGHTRSLDLRADGTALERIYDGCCDHVVDVTLHVSKGRGNRRHGSVLARVTKVRVFDSTDYPTGDRPRVGDTARMRVRRGVLHEPFTQTVYCTGRAARHSTCGA